MSRQVERSARTEAVEAASTLRASRARWRCPRVQGRRGSTACSTTRASSSRGFASGSDYDALFAALAAEALDGVEGQVVIRVAPADVELARADGGAARRVCGKSSATSTPRAVSSSRPQAAASSGATRFEDRLEQSSPVRPGRSSEGAVRMSRAVLASRQAEGRDRRRLRQRAPSRHAVAPAALGVPRRADRGARRRCTRSRCSEGPSTGPTSRLRSSTGGRPRSSTRR